MVLDGDRILVGLSGTSASLSLLHALRQFVRARQLHVELAAVQLGGGCDVDPRALMLYLRDLGVRFHCEPLGESTDQFVWQCVSECVCACVSRLI